MHAFYAVLFGIFLCLAVAFCDFKGSSGLSVLFEIYILTFAMKVFMDDYAHFKINRQKIIVERGLLITLAMWIMMIGAAIAAPKSFSRSAYYMIAVNILGIVWLALDHVGVAIEDEHRRKSVGWLVINCIHVFILATILVFLPTWHPYAMMTLVCFLLGLLLFDFVKYKTIQYLVAAHNSPTPISAEQEEKKV